MRGKTFSQNVKLTFASNTQHPANNVNPFGENILCYKPISNYPSHSIATGPTAIDVCATQKVKLVRVDVTSKVQQLTNPFLMENR